MTKPNLKLVRMYPPPRLVGVLFAGRTVAAEGVDMLEADARIHEARGWSRAPFPAPAPSSIVRRPSTSDASSAAPDDGAKPDKPATSKKKKEG